MKKPCRRKWKKNNDNSYWNKKKVGRDRKRVYRTNI